VSAGYDVIERIQARRDRPDAGLFVGAGKAEEIGARVKELEAAVAIFNQELSPVQQRNLSRLWDCPVLDRTELILDIFARRARSHEGKLQVELARLEHLSARLVRGWTHLERQRGGIGVRGGPGETQLELDRRMLGVKVRRLREQLEQLRRQRRTRKRARDRRPAFSISLVGYTNAGKSTLFNALTGAQTLAADQLFATLDTLTRRLQWSPGVHLVISDTVGFVRNLPHQLVEAFTATLEETATRISCCMWSIPLRPIVMNRLLRLIVCCVTSVQTACRNCWSTTRLTQADVLRVRRRTPVVASSRLR